MDNGTSKAAQPEPPQGSFVCSWCKEAGLTPEEYTHEPEQYGGWDNATGLPICENCRDGIVGVV